MNVRKFGEASPMVTPSQAEQSEGVESRHGLSSTDKGVLQTTNRNGDENRSGKKTPRLMACGFDSRLPHQKKDFNKLTLCGLCAGSILFVAIVQWQSASLPSWMLRVQVPFATPSAIVAQ